VKLDIWRNKKPMTVTIELGSVWPYLYLAHGYDVKPRYIVYGGLVFQPLTLDLIDAYQPTDVRIRHYFDYFVLEQIYLEHPEIIILTNILPDPTNTYLSSYRGGILDEVNGKKIRKLNDLAAAFAEKTDRFVLRLIGDGPPLVLDPKEVESARERIKSRYNVLVDQNLEEQPSKPTPADRFVVRMIGDGPPLVLDPKEVESARERIKTRYNVGVEQNLSEQPAEKPASADPNKS